MTRSVDDGDAWSPRSHTRDEYCNRSPADGGLEDSGSSSGNPSSSQAGSDPIGGASLDERFWLVLHEPGSVPQRKGSWPRSEIKTVLREFMAARPTAYIDVLTLEADGPNVQHGPEVLQILDGRSMGVGRRHNKQTREAHADFHAAIAKAVKP